MNLANGVHYIYGAVQWSDLFMVPMLAIVK